MELLYIKVYKTWLSMFQNLLWVYGRVPQIFPWRANLLHWTLCIYIYIYIYIYIHTAYKLNLLFFCVLDLLLHCIKVLTIFTSGGPLSALTCCVNVRLLSAIKKISPLIYSQSWVGSWVYTTQAMMTFTLIF